MTNRSPSNAANSATKAARRLAAEITYEGSNADRLRADDQLWRRDLYLPGERVRINEQVQVPGVMLGVLNLKLGDQPLEISNTIVRGIERSTGLGGSNLVASTEYEFEGHEGRFPAAQFQGEPSNATPTIAQIKAAIAAGRLQTLPDKDLHVAATVVVDARIAREREGAQPDPLLETARNAIWSERADRTVAAARLRTDAAVEQGGHLQLHPVMPSQATSPGEGAATANPQTESGGDRAPPEFARIFELRRERHADGYRAETNYVSGSCAVMATALLNEMGGELVMLVVRDEPEFAMHFAVHRDGIVSDVDGHFELGTWRKAWADKFNKDLAVTRSTPALMEELMNIATYGPERNVVSEADLDRAAPLAKALADARGLDPAAWWIDPSRRIRPEHELPHDADEAWRTALARGPMPAGPTTTLHPVPVRTNRVWIIPELTPADGIGRQAVTLGHRAAMTMAARER
jgi:hypothetical protein